MTGRTHDLAAFTALSWTVATQPIPQDLTLATVIVALSANFIGGLAPDIDQSTATLWHRMRGGSLIGKLMAPLFGGHRFISHSLLGVAIFGIGFKFILQILSPVLIVNMDIIWWSFMIGFVSHLLMDSISRDGVPWLFPIPIRLGFPPLRALRIKTGGILEKSFVFPALILTNIWIYYHYYNRFLEIIKWYIK
jgi:inner membrane protein